jgi:hypothetical protein
MQILAASHSNHHILLFPTGSFNPILTNLQWLPAAYGALPTFPQMESHSKLRKNLLRNMEEGIKFVQRKRQQLSGRRDSLGIHIRQWNMGCQPPLSAVGETTGNVRSHLITH